MPEIKRTTREVTRYTLDLSGEEFDALYNAYALTAPLANPLRVAMREALDAKTALADGDRLRITGDEAGSATGERTDLVAGDIVTVLDATPDLDGDMYVEDKNGDGWYLAATGPRAQWERVTGESTPAPLAVGDRIRILRDGYHGARVEAGDVLTVQSVSGLYGSFTTNAPRHIHNPATGKWTFSADGEGDGWERVGLRRIAKGDDVRLLKDVGSYTAGRLLKVQEDPNRYRNFAARAPFNSTALLSEDSEGDVWQRVGA